MTQPEKDLIDEKFRGIASLMNAHFENVDEKLERIENQTVKTNGRVTELEKKELIHLAECPAMPEIQAIKDDLAEYRFFKKYPKIAIGIVFVLIMSFGITIFQTYTKVNENFKLNTELIQNVDSLNAK